MQTQQPQTTPPENHIAVLKRRVEHLCTRLSDAHDSRKLSYDRAEAAALLYVIRKLAPPPVQDEIAPLQSKWGGR